jgi:hydrogenase maturation protein HypF
LPAATTDDRDPDRVRLRIRVEGRVQGVGFRPFVHSLAHSLDVTGFVRNDPTGVTIEAEGRPPQLRSLVETLEREPPPLAVVERIELTPMRPVGSTTFAIAASGRAGEHTALVPPDTATCEDCRRETFDPADRRFRYPFTNCTNCGPRFTIVRDIPYDRPFTTMAEFPMCDDCAEEYADPSGRRFHAQATCCPVCGPQLRLVDASGKAIAGDPIVSTSEILRASGVVAVKGLGGYHLAAVASDEVAVASVRARKHREDKPFAVMAADLDAARSLADFDADEGALLTSMRRPIVLARRRTGSPLAPTVAPGNRFVGVMLPYTPLHHLLAAEVGEPMVLTSGNRSDEPICHRDDDALARLAGVAEAFLTHDRPIHTRTDDSVVRVLRGRPMMVRRSRGFVPEPVPLARQIVRPVLACGAELKNTFCLARGGHAFLSHHIGDLENYETYLAFTEGIEHLCRLLELTPRVVAHDLHPEYLSTKYALVRRDVELVGVQHHHAHIAACLADCGEDGPVIGVAFDGLGFGLDGTLWGGELLIADLVGFERVGHLAPVPMPGGAAAVREPWRMAVAHLDAAGVDAVDDLAVARRHSTDWSSIRDIGRSGTNSPMTSSMGRLFDAVAALVGGRDLVNYEGQAAIELEQMADPTEAGAYPMDFVGENPGQWQGAGVIGAVVDDLRSGVDAPIIAARFHNAVAAAIVDGCRAARRRAGLATVALSGGVFQNRLLVERTVTGLEAAGFRVLVHSRVPPNDGGVSLGQAVVADARTRSADAR